MYLIMSCLFSFKLVSKRVSMCRMSAFKSFISERIHSRLKPKRLEERETDNISVGQSTLTGYLYYDTVI